MVEEQRVEDPQTREGYRLPHQSRGDAGYVKLLHLQVALVRLQNRPSLEVLQNFEARLGVGKEYAFDLVVGGAPVVAVIGHAMVAEE